MLAEWLREPQVARWWNHETTLEAVERDFGASARGEEPGEDLLVLLDGLPIGLLQRSAICDYPQDLTEFSAVIEVPVGAVELDYLIADPALRGRGLGSRMIAAAVEDTWNSYSDAPAVLAAVVAANVASWRALEKAGLKRVAEGPMSPDNPIDDALRYIYRVDRPGGGAGLTWGKVSLLDPATDAGDRLPGRRPSAGELAGVPGEGPSPDLEGAVAECGGGVEDPGVAVV